MSWSGMRKKLEDEYLAPCLRGRIRYFAASYSKCPDHEGRAAIVFDGEEILRGSYREQFSRASELPKDDTLEKRLTNEFPFMDDTALKYGQFDQRCFYNAFREFDSQSIEKSLSSNDLLVRIFAVLDRRVGKRRLSTIGEKIDEEPESLRKFYEIRLSAEKMT